MLILTLLILFANTNTNANTNTSIILKKDTDESCSLNINGNLTSIKKIYDSTSITCNQKQLKYNASCSSFVISKEQFNESFIMYYGNSSSIINFQDNAIYNNNELYGYIVDDLYYDVTKAPLFKISYDNDTECNITSLNNYSDFDLQLVIAIYTSTLFDGGNYPVKSCNNFTLFFVILVLVMCITAAFAMMKKNDRLGWC